MRFGFFSAAARKRSAQPPQISFDLKQALQQIRRLGLHPAKSDHIAIVKTLSNIKLLSFNMMMECKPHNNGFSKTETRKEYRQRVADIASTLAEMLEKDPSINVITLQEAPIKPEDIAIMADIFAQFLPGWERAQFEMTDFGLMTLINTKHKAYYPDNKLSDALASKKLADRCLTFKNNANQKISNIHVPHATPEASLHAILKEIIDDAIAEKIIRHDIAGDFNLNPDQVERVLRTVWHKAAEGNPAFKLSAEFDPSTKGHRKANGDEIDADGVLTLDFKAEDGNKNQLKYNRFGCFAAFVAGVVALTPEGVIDNVAVTTAMKIAPSF